ncbi:uncharacterized protein LOC125379151 isoform X2 [Haliotis rufescens]|uniref:uncharacterized protein LOC125379151 isoform X2 n=1 Tax=Haliotis rufescens TaxID=6454 RepID=UPI00201EDCE1|nr:uncharacterized protein LOC125379151 isoform X2 [Haliotis rufescens]
MYTVMLDCDMPTSCIDTLFSITSNGNPGLNPSEPFTTRTSSISKTRLTAEGRAACGCQNVRMNKRDSHLCSINAMKDHRRATKLKSCLRSLDEYSRLTVWKDQTRES